MYGDVLLRKTTTGQPRMTTPNVWNLVLARVKAADNTSNPCRVRSRDMAASERETKWVGMPARSSMWRESPCNDVYAGRLAGAEPNAASTRFGVSGNCRNLTPVASKNA